MSNMRVDRTESEEVIAQSIGSFAAAQYPTSPPSKLQTIIAFARLAFKAYIGTEQAIAGSTTNEENMKMLVEHARDIHMEIQSKTIIYVDEDWVDSKFGIEELNGFSGSALGFGGGVSYLRVFSGEERFWAVNKKCDIFVAESNLASHVGKSLRFEGVAQKNGGLIEAESKRWNSFKLVLGPQVLNAFYQDANLKAEWSIDDVIKLSKVIIVSEVGPSPKLFVRAIYAEKATLRVQHLS